MHNHKESRRTFIKTSGAAGLGVLCGAAIPSDTLDIIYKAGNTESEKERYQLLNELYNTFATKESIKKELSKLLPLIDDWANGKEKAEKINDPEKGNVYLMHYLTTRKVNLEQDFPERVATDSPLYPIWCLFRGRLLIYITIQIGEILLVDERRVAYYGEGIRLLKIAQEAFPNNRVIGMYLEQPIAWKIKLSNTDGAPTWAVSQRESIERLREIIHWWIDNRQLEHGGYGGGWGDDCEMWRWWAPLLIGFEDPKITDAQEKLSKGLLALPRLKGGYTNRMTDVEHTAEETSDVITPMMHLKPKDAYWQGAALRLHELSESLWGGINEQGYWQFKTSYFNIDSLDMAPERACDTMYHFRVLQPVLLYWQRTRDPELTKFFKAWMDNWLAVSMRKDKGKPPGIIPTAVHWPDGLAGGLNSDNWWEPGNYTSKIYDWPRRINTIATTLVQTYFITGEEKYLQPINEMVKIRLKYLAKNKKPKNPKPGSVNWCAAQLGDVLSEPLSKYRLLTGDTRFDNLLAQDATDYVKFRLGADRDVITKGLEKYGSALKVNFEAYTSEVRHTDRVLAFNDNYLKTIDSRVVSSSEIARTLYYTITGDLGTLSYFPLNAVRWKTPAKDLAILVTNSGDNTFAADLYHFGDDTRLMEAEFYLLKSGDYVLEYMDEQRKTFKTQAFHSNGKNTLLSMEIPPKQLITLSIKEGPK